MDTPTGSGCTVTVEVKELPVQPPVVGTIVKITVWSVPVTLRRVPEISPVPPAAMPVTLMVLSLVHAYVVPDRLLLVLKAIVVRAVLLQRVCVAGVATPTGSGCTVTVEVKELPVQPPVVGTIVKITVWSVPVTLRRVPEISPVPVAAIPVTFVVLSLVQV